MMKKKNVMTPEAEFGNMMLQLLANNLANGSIAGQFNQQGNSPKKKRGTKKRTGDELYTAAQMGMPLTRDELAELYNVCTDTITRWVNQGLPTLYIGKLQRSTKGARPRFIYSKCEAWLEKKRACQCGQLTLEDFIRKYAA